MNRILQDFFQGAYSKLEADLVSNWAVDREQLTGFSDIVKGIAKRQLSLSCAATVSGLRSQRNEYAWGLIEASYLSMVVAVKGMENCACSLLRQTIELTLKHVYFATHPVEYGWALTRESYKALNFQGLLEYVKSTDEYREFSQCGESNLSEVIEERFAVLSRHVHVQNKRFMSYRKMRTEQKVDEVLLRRVSGLTASLWPSLTAMLVIFFPDRFERAHEIEKKLIRNTFSHQVKQTLAGYLRRRS